MNGADKLCDVLLANEVDLCFANPGTSEMHFVAALDRRPEMRCILGLSEGVVTGAADGYGRMADKPAATLLHLGPGLANGLANLHNARRARTPILNVVGDHATHHLAFDSPLTSDIESLAAPMSIWVDRVRSVDDIRERTEEGLNAAKSRRGPATMILPADHAWGRAEDEAVVRTVPPAPPSVASAALDRAVAMLRSGRRTAIILSGRALRADALEWAGRVSKATGATLLSQTSARTERGAGRAFARPIPYPVDMAIELLKDLDAAICIGNSEPVAFFAYPGKPSTVLPEHCDVLHLADHQNDLHAVLAELADALGLGAGAPFEMNRLGQSDIALPTGALDANAISVVVARHLPSNAIICEETITSGGRMPVLAPTLVPHDHLALTGGAIGIGIPLATGAAIACPGRKVISLQADGSAMYTLHALWTQAREQLDVVTIIYANRAYAILQAEMRNVGVQSFGANARAMLDLRRPDLDWCSLARGMGVEAGRAETVDEFTKLLEGALRSNGPFLIEARL